MQTNKKQLKEAKIIKAAESVFGKVGFKNAKMDDIAKEAGITKVTLYSYFQSKENLYLAITYRALSLLNDDYYQTIDQFKNRPGKDCVLALMKAFMDFCENNYLYSEAMLDYFSVIRSTSHGQDKLKLTSAVKESLYFLKLQDIHNLPYKLTAMEIQRGIDDKSIHAEVDPMLYTLHGWSLIIGYVKLISASGDNLMPLFNVSLKKLRKFNIRLAGQLLEAPIDMT